MWNICGSNRAVNSNSFSPRVVPGRYNNNNSNNYNNNDDNFGNRWWMHSTKWVRVPELVPSKWDRVAEPYSGRRPTASADRCSWLPQAGLVSMPCRKKIHRFVHSKPKLTSLSILMTFLMKIKTRQIDYTFRGLASHPRVSGCLPAWVGSCA